MFMYTTQTLLPFYSFLMRAPPPSLSPAVLICGSSGWWLRQPASGTRGDAFDGGSASDELLLLLLLLMPPRAATRRSGAAS
jgi:hypothetical protein